MKNLFFLMLCAYIPIELLSQNVGNPPLKSSLNISVQVESKILSGKLIESIQNVENLTSGNLKSARNSTCSIILYFKDFPSPTQIQELENLGVTLYFNTWTPPLENHPLGFLIANVPVNNILKVLKLSSVKKMDTGERSNKALNNTASLCINAQMAWSKGYTGKGKKICILDSGIDTTYKGTDLPLTFQSKDYSNFPILDNDVANKVTGHGTHVSATALGRGVLSEGQNHWNNGKGAFKGMAPEADLVFLKIGQDEDAISEDPPTIAAIDAAINIYHADVISMSYGGWDDFHDGSSALEQKVDWAYSQGVPFFISAGNDGDHQKHWMGNVAANSQSGFIEVHVSDPKGDTTMLRFNMIWVDGDKRNDLSLLYFDASKNQLSNVTQFPATESLKGTESRYSYYENALYSAGTYYLKVVNNSNYSQQVHLYEDWNNQRIGTDHVTFTNSEPLYTVSSPSSAEHAFSVGAYVSKTGWTNPNDNSRWYGASSVLNNIAPFSSRGPTVDQRIKPDICAPGSVIISLRDKNIYKTLDFSWVDNDGLPGGDANYYAMRGTSMACPVVAGAAALYLEKHPNATPQQVYDAMKNFSNRTEISNLPNNTWGAGKLDINTAIQGFHDLIQIDGDMKDEKYETLASFTSERNGYGNKNTLGELKYHTDGENLYIGITGEVTDNDNILLFMDFSVVQGRGTNTLGGGNDGDFVYCPFAYMGNVKMDFDVDYALGFNKGNSTQFEFFTDAIRYGTSNTAANIGKTNQMGASSDFEIGSFFGGTGFITVAFDSSYSINHSKGVEVKIPISAFAGVDTSQTLRLFAVISSEEGDVSNECIPGDPGPNNLGDGADFSVIPNQDFFTQPVKISIPKATTIVLSNEAPGFLIDKLIAAGFSYSNLYDVMVSLKPTSGGVITDEFLNSLAACPAGSEIFTATLNDIVFRENNSVGINTDGTLIVLPIFGKDYFGKEGYFTYPKTRTVLERKLFTYAAVPDYYIDAGISNTRGDSYKVFAIGWSLADTLSVTPNTLNIAATSESIASVSILSNTGWLVSSDQTWLKVNPASGTGNDTLTITSEANPLTISRTATVTISVTGLTSQTITVTQAAGAATLSVSQTELDINATAGSTKTFTVTSNTKWIASSNKSWISVSPASNTGNDTVSITAGANPTIIQRTAIITISATGVASKTITVTQAAGAATLSVSPITLSVASAEGSTAEFNISSNTSWSATSDQVWLKVSLTSGTGNGSVTVTAEKNQSTTERTAIVTVSSIGLDSKTIIITQISGTATLSVSPSTLENTAIMEDTTTFEVASNITWSANSDQTWLTISPTTGTGDGTVTVTSEANPTVTERIAIITVSANGVASQTVIVTQSAGFATLSVSSSTLEIGATEGSTASFNVSSNTTWSAISDQLWLTLNPGTSTGNGAVTITAKENPSTNERTATITVSTTGADSKSVSVTQETKTAIVKETINKISVYPNPFTEGFYVNPGNRITTVSVYDIRGRLIFTRKISGVEYFTADWLENGMYLLKLTNSREIVRKNLIKL
jgi:subtilisin family serine protease